MVQAFSEIPGFESNVFSLYTHWMKTSDPKSPIGRPNRFSFPPLLKTCVGVRALMGVHGQVEKIGVSGDVYVGTTLVDCYSKCGAVGFARSVFDEMRVRNVVSWNTMISGLAKSGDVGGARELFEGMPERNLVSWTSLISGYAQNGFFREALDVYEWMGVEGVRANEVTLVSVLSACANIGALSMGRKVHSFMEDRKFELNVFVGSALIDMYSKCGMIGDALRVFQTMRHSNVVACSAMIVGLAMNGKGVEAIEIFEMMKLQGMLPNEITFIGVLCACCHTGMVDKGKIYYSSMTQEYSLVPKLQHYACMVDLYGRAGYLDQAYEFIKEMPIKPDVVVWGALLGACKTHKDFKLGVFAANQILELEPRHSGAFVFLSSASAKAGDWDGVKKVKQMIDSSGMKRTAGKSWIELNNVVHQFFAGDQSHPQSDKIYARLDELGKLLEVEGYKPNVDSVISDIDDEEKELSLNVHSEKLAIAFGLINTPEGTLIRIVKNIRVCDDCHSSIKLISKIVNRDIVLRDGNRFHHFSGGLCSCQDYW
ncbi:hypothetical protein GIB67_017177 [Kingdonia uniflora]|uniref:DYW domain-containing protein n=1 Tax=Kingdonia uniflora TaxID=39325 RepID=A0A7J7NL55_9MAGN|nr:hypothetical protein GIB67_017177 [Kingdonia uniflora]